MDMRNEQEAMVIDPVRRYGHQFVQWTRPLYLNWPVADASPNSPVATDMSLKPDLLKILDRLYAPNAMVELRYKRLDARMATDGEGRPCQLFLGKRGPDGRIHGERYMRNRSVDRDGKVIKDHWDQKGKAS
jgi:hypothetical protein